jgi:small subunit ribosomal protein S4
MQKLSFNCFSYTFKDEKIMSRYRGARLKISRRLGMLPGLSSKTPNKLEKLEQPPGQHGKNKSSRGRSSSSGGGGRIGSEYAMRLEAKQKVRFNYGLSERQLMGYVAKARKIQGATGGIILQLIEMRLDNILFRGGMATTIAAARQLVTHRHIRVNDKPVSIPSYQCQPGDKIQLKDPKIINAILTDEKTKPLLKQRRSLSSYLQYSETSTPTLLVKHIVPRADVFLNINELFVVEFYARRGGV